jgi:polysaccharide biosynthesis/export protein
MDKLVFRSRAILFPLIALIFTACVPQKKLRYFQEHAADTSFAATSIYAAPPYLLQPGDILQVQIFSASPDLPQIPGFEASTNLGTTASVYLQGYQISSEGTLKLPLLGVFTAHGITIADLQQQVAVVARDRISLDADVSIRLVNYRITVLGEVVAPGVLEVYDGRISIPEALARCGDMTVYGNRQNVMIIRENAGKKELITVDLTDRGLLHSPHFYLQNHDILYIQPLNAKSYGFAQVQWGAILSSVSTIIAIMALIYKK